MATKRNFDTSILDDEINMLNPSMYARNSYDDDLSDVVVEGNNVEEVSYQEVQSKIEQYNSFKWPELPASIKSEYSDLSPLEVLSRVWGYNSFRGEQASIIQSALNGHDVFVMMATGGGKSVSFQLPALIRDGVAIIISPIIALINDQFNDLKARNVPVAKLTNDMDIEKRKKIMKEIQASKYKMVFVSPERILSESFQECLKHTPVSIIVFDEAHCLYQWGQSFRRSYLYAATLLRKIPVPKMALTATIKEDGKEKIKHLLGISDCDEFLGSSDRKNLRYLIENVGSHENLYPKLIDYMEKIRGQNCIIYRNNKKEVEEINDLLQRHGHRSLMFHADMPARDKYNNMRIFKEQESIVMVATIAFGMGIDKSNVRNVINVGPSSSIEAYCQETGRAGRDGQPATVKMFYSDQHVVKMFSHYHYKKDSEKTHSDEEVNMMYNNLMEMQSLMMSPICRRRVILDYYGEDSHHDCGNCDICLSKSGQFSCDAKELNTFDAETEVKNLLSLLSWLNTKKKKAPTVPLLSSLICGHSTTQIERLNLSDNPYWNQSNGHTQYWWNTIIYELIAIGFISLVDKGHLRVTGKGFSFLQNPHEIVLISHGEIIQKGNYSSAKSLLNDIQKDLFSEIQDWIKNIKRIDNFEGDIISEKNIMSIISNTPLSRHELKERKVMDANVILRHGESFLAIMRKYPTLKPVAKPLLNNLFKKKKPLNTTA